VTINIEILHAANDVNTFLFDFYYDLSVLRYYDYQRGSLTTNGFLLFNVNNHRPGIVRVGGIEAGPQKIEKGNKGSLVRLIFYVNGGNKSDLTLNNLKDDIKGWSFNNGLFICSNCEEKDIDQEETQKLSSEDIFSNKTDFSRNIPQKQINNSVSSIYKRKQSMLDSLDSIALNNSLDTKPETFQKSLISTKEKMQTRKFRYKDHQKDKNKYLNLFSQKKINESKINNKMKKSIFHEDDNNIDLLWYVMYIVLFSTVIMLLCIIKFSSYLKK
jgi:hypothetical protein